MREFDLIVIGSGSGLDVANAVAQDGLRVAIIEKARMGGTCLNRGCIPSKLLIHSADVAETIKGAGQFGINVSEYSVDFEKIVSRTNNIVDSDSDGIRRAFSEIDNPKLFPHEGRFVGEKTISVGGQEIKAQKILIASGTRPAIPKIKGLEGTGFITSDEALRLKKQPPTLTIIGGGYIAAELAHFFGSLGTKINIIQRHDVLLPDEDEEVARKFTEVFSKKYSVFLGYSTESVGKSNGMFNIVAKNSSGKRIEIESDQLLVDAVGRYLFKHAANHEAQYAYYNLTHDKKIPVDYTAMPHAIFSSPQVAGAGYTEQELKEKGIPYTKGVYPYIRTAMGEAIEDRDGFVNLLASKEGKILGCHIIGSHASVLIHEVLVAMKLGASVHDIVRTVHVHPALSEVVARAASAFG
ncbi:MAG: dihydrolipoyl dehydrogenase [Thaumarchaeota archaeon]|nr:MAG: dihydrolipoyl dehydrogenase [Nitrososphaerota archaeon]